MVSYDRGIPFFGYVVFVSELQSHSCKWLRLRVLKIGVATPTGASIVSPAKYRASRANESSAVGQRGPRTVAKVYRCSIFGWTNPTI